MDQDRNNFFDTLQSLDPATKTKLLIGATAVAMVVVIFLWVGYFNTILASVNTGNANTIADESTSTAPVAEEDQVSPIQHFTNSMAFALGQFEGLFKGIGGLFHVQREYNIEPQPTQSQQ